MRVILFTLIILSFNLSFSQKIKQKTKYNGGKKDVFYQTKIKGVGKVKVGEFKRYLTSNHKPNILVQEGQYENNEKSGVWTYYNSIGDSIFSYNFEIDSVVYFNKKAKRDIKRYRKFFSKGSENVYATSYNFLIDNGFDITNSISTPIFIDGDFEFYDILFTSVLKSIKYYDSNNRAYGMSNYTNNFSNLIILKISKSGKLDDVLISTPYNNQLSSLKNILLDQDLIWIPAYKYNEAVDYELTIPVFCNSIDNDASYNFEIKFCREEEYEKQMPYCDKWPNRISPSAKIWVWSLKEK